MFNETSFNEAEFNQAEHSSQNGSFFYLFDQNANTRYLVNGANEISDSSLYRAFGEQELSVGNTRNPYGFQGEFGPYTDVAKRIWMRARIYDPEVGRCYSEDPIGFAGMDWNLYRYVVNNPVNLYDPYGLQVQIYYGMSAGGCFWSLFNYEKANTTKSEYGICVQVKGRCARELGKTTNIDCSQFPTTSRRPKPSSCPAKDTDACKNIGNKENCDICNNKFFQECQKQAGKFKGIHKLNPFQFAVKSARIASCRYVQNACAEYCTVLGTDPFGQSQGMIDCWEKAKEIQEFFE